MRPALLSLVVFTACGTRTPTTTEMTCSAPMFGRLVTQSGLTNAQCRASCGCGGDGFTPTEFTPDRLERLTQWTLLDAPPDVSVDPYTQPVPDVPPGVCAVQVVDESARTYRLKTFSTEAEAKAQGARVTHLDSCGACSTLADLAVFGREADLGRRVQDCGVKTVTAGLEANVKCLTDLGFTQACARIWGYNTRFTRGKCLGVCFTLLDAPYHLADGGVNECLACDTREAGAIFRVAAGRTRKNTAVPSALCQPCAEVPRITHEW
ncbi:MAG: hypothetical protein JNJ54_31560 [Myxococcaceae bacterium]|nr:hypothetical protein [Myxococcaceae bacterium]